eukprot:3331415-Pyramimonas_sp.AAC.2
MRCIAERGSCDVRRNPSPADNRPLQPHPHPLPSPLTPPAAAARVAHSAEGLRGNMSAPAWRMCNTPRPRARRSAPA